MAVVAVSVNCHRGLGVVAVAVAETQPQSPNRCSSLDFRSFFTPIAAVAVAVPPRRRPLVRGFKESSDSQTNRDPDEEVNNLGVKAALSMLRFYKREISPLLPNSCRYVPTCSEYSMEAYKKYGVVKGTVLTAWRLCRCNPLGGSGFDPPRWFDEKSLPEE